MREGIPLFNKGLLHKSNHNDKDLASTPLIPHPIAALIKYRINYIFYSIQENVQTHLIFFSVSKDC